MGPSADPVEIRVYGPGFADMKTLRQFADRVKDMITPVPGHVGRERLVGCIRVPAAGGRGRGRGQPGRRHQRRIAQTLNAYYSGHHLTTFREGDHLVPVYLRLRLV